MSSTKKVKTAGRYGSRYGIGVRKRLIQIEQKQKQLHACPKCGFQKVKRQAAGIFECRKCHARFAGGAFTPQTLTGSIVFKMVNQKSFLPSMTELLTAKEPVEEKTEPKESKSHPKKE